jgi:hypothetical protein
MEYTGHYVSGISRTPIDEAIQEFASAAWRALAAEPDKG